MRVVPAGVLHAFDRRAIVRGQHVFDRQRVHVRAQRDHRAGLAAAQDRDDAVFGDARLHLEPERAQSLGDDAAGALFAVRQLGVAREVTARLRQLLRHRLRAVLDATVERAAVSRRRGDAG